jgi:hypothetical protein
MIRVDCVTWLDEVENSIPSIVLAARSERGDETRVRVVLDGEVVAERLDGRAMELDPGAHELRFELEPYPPVLASILVREGQRNRVIAAWFAQPPLPPPPPSPPPGGAPEPPTLALVLGGVAVAGVATAAGFGLAALRFRHDRREACAPLCTEDDERALRARAIASDVGLSVALLAAGGTALVLVRSTRRDVTRTTSRHRIGLGAVGAGAGVWVEGGLP